MFRKLYLKWLAWRGKAIDIRSKKTYPAGVLSNLYSNEFRFGNIKWDRMESFLHSLKQEDTNKQQIWWNGQTLDRHSEEYQDLIRQAYQAMFEQNERFRAALMSTRGKTLFHSRGERNPYKTPLTAHEFCTILTELRDKYDNWTKIIDYKRHIYVYLDNLQMGFRQLPSDYTISVNGVVFEGINDIKDYWRRQTDTSHPYIVERSQRFPCFDSSDYAYENRYFWNFLFCHSKKEAERKELIMAQLRQGDNFCLVNEDLPADMRPMLYYEDGRSSMKLAL